MQADEYGHLTKLENDPVRYIAHYANLKPDFPAIACSEKLLSYSQLLAEVNSVALHLRQAGVKQGEAYSLFFKSELSLILCALAMQRLGATCLFVPQNSPVMAERSSGIIADQQKSIVSKNLIYFDRSWPKAAPVGPETLIFDGYASQEDCIVVTTSSGTTAKPKIIGSPLRKVLASIVGSLAHQEHNPNLAPTYIALNPRALFGFRQILTVLWSGGTLVLGEIGLMTAHMLKPLGVKRIVTSAAEFVYFVELAEKNSSLFLGIEAITYGGGHLSELLLNRLRQVIPAEIYSNFGSSETGLIAAGNIDLALSYQGAVGVVLDSVKIEIVETTGNPVKAGDEGLLRVYVGKGKDSFGGSKFVEGWFETGDRAVLHPGNILSILGRRDDVINFGSFKLVLAIVEEKLLLYRGLADGAFLAAPNQHGINELHCFYVTNDLFNIDEFLQKLQEFPRLQTMCRLLEIPRGPSGKVDRHRLMEIHTAQK